MKYKKKPVIIDAEQLLISEGQREVTIHNRTF